MYFIFQKYFYEFYLYDLKIYNINLKQISTVKLYKQSSFWKMLLGVFFIIWWLLTIILPIIWLILLFPNVYIAIYNTWLSYLYSSSFLQNKFALEFAWTLNNTIIENN